MISTSQTSHDFLAQIDKTRIRLASGAHRGDLLRFLHCPPGHPDITCIITDVVHHQIQHLQSREHIEDVALSNRDCTCNICYNYFMNTYIRVLWGSIDPVEIAALVNCYRDGFYVEQLEEFEKIDQL